MFHRHVFQSAGHPGVPVRVTIMPLRHPCVALFLFGLVLTCWPALSLAQVVGGGGGGGGAGGGGTGGGGTGGGGQTGGGTGQSGGTGVAGVYVDVEGLLQTAVRPVPPRSVAPRPNAASRKPASQPKAPGGTARLPSGKNGQAAPLPSTDIPPGAVPATPDRDVQATSPQRVVSLARIEALLRPFVDGQTPVTPDLDTLAGLTRIDALVALPEQHDILLIGPAEGMAIDPWGRAVGTTTGLPALRLEDLLVLLRVSRERTFGCSIDPQPERLAELTRFLSTNNGPSTAAAVKARFDRLDDILGPQQVRFLGLPPESRAALVCLEADYLMKRVGLGLEPVRGKGFRSHLALLAPGGNTMQRWWFAPLYEPFATTDDRQAWSFAGPRVQLLSEQELVDATGRRSSATGSAPVTTTKYAKQFNAHFDELARAIPSFGELRGLFDLMLAVAVIDREDWRGTCQLPLTLLNDPKQLTVAERPVPRQVPSLVNYKQAGGLVIGLVGGGVTCAPQAVLASPTTDPETGAPVDLTPRKTALEALRPRLTPPADPTHWWWDLAP